MLDERLAMVVDFEETDQTFIVTMSDAPPVTRPYSGPYVVTPSHSKQRLSTEGKALESDIIVEAIPNNYGRIKWNGSGLMIY